MESAQQFSYSAFYVSKRCLIGLEHTEQKLSNNYTANFANVTFYIYN